MARRALLDTGFVVALVHAGDPDHERCVAASKTVHAKLLSVEGVLIECAHLLGKRLDAVRAAMGFISASSVELVPTTEARIQRALTLMEKYRDIPMDFVDALLVVIAEEENVRDVLTLDRRGFEVFRIRGRRRFRLFP